MVSARSVRAIVFLVVLVALLFPGAARRAAAQNQGVVVITEIMYHPQGGGQDLEYVELYNAAPNSVDLSGWYFSAGIAFEFPAGVWLDGGRYLVVCANEQRVREVYKISNTIGDWGIDCDSPTDAVGCGLSNGGEAIALSEPTGVVHARVRYNDRGKWPAAADGTGHSLELVYVYSEQDDPDSWAMSELKGGTPGRANSAGQNTLPVVINEALLLTSAERWIELFNTSETETVDLSGYWVSNERLNHAKALLPPGTEIEPRSYLVLEESDLGIDLEPVAAPPDPNVDPPVEPQARTFVVLTNPDGVRVIDAYTFEPVEEGKSEARLPDGDQTVSVWAEPTPGEPNHALIEENVVINEVMYHPIDRNPDREYIEIYNRGEYDVDLTGWSFPSGVNYAFEKDTTLGAKEYLVIARNPRVIQEVYGLDSSKVVGPDPDDEAAVEEFGRLRDDGEKIVLLDQHGNVADSVRFHDGGQWPLWADGGGSSMELIDPFQLNDVGSAWDSSDDSAKAEAVDFSYEGTYLTGEPELHVVLAHRGISVVDDLKIFQRTVTFEAHETLISAGEEWRYFKGTEEPTEDRTAWRQLDFQDDGWAVGTTPIGYGEGDEGTVLDDMPLLFDDPGTPDVDESQPGYLSFYCRKKFVIPDLSAIQTLALRLEYDDGTIVYLNGTRVALENMLDGNDAYNSAARGTRERYQTTVELSQYGHLLNEGENVLAAQVHNRTLTSDDARFILELVNGENVNEDGPSQLANGDFEAELDESFRPGGWMIEGTHRASGRTTVDPIAGAASLKVVASAKGDNKSNRLEATLPPLRGRSLYTVEFKARWVVGAVTLLTHGHNLNSAAFDYPKAHTLGVPQNLGTPGEVNSVTLRQIARTGDANIGPVISKVSQSEGLPPSGRPVDITARVRDSDGVETVRLYYWTENSTGAPGPASTAEIPMEGPDVRGLYRATIPGQTSRAKVVFYIVATDKKGQEGRYPLDMPQRTHPLLLDPEDPEQIDLSFCVYRHDTPLRPPNARWQAYRFWMPYANELHMTRQRLLSNDRMEGSFLFENRDIYYNARTRFSGSPFARRRFTGSYRVYMPKDRSLHGSRIKRFNAEDHQNGATSCFERLSHYLIRHNHGAHVVPYSFQWLVQWQMNDKINTAREHVEAPNPQFVEYWYPDDDDGDFFEMDDRHQISDSGSRVNSGDARWTYPPMRSGDGSDKENYRWFFNVRLNKSHDDHTTLIEGARILDPSETTDAELNEVVWDHFDLEEMLRVWAIRMNTADWDTWGTNRGKNCYVYRPRANGRWKLFAWDMELSYANNEVSRFMPGSITSPYNSINTTKFPEVFRLINQPRIKRMYYGIMKEMLDHQFNSTFLAPYRSRLAQLGMNNLDRLSSGGFIDQRNSLLRGVVDSAAYPRVRLAVTTNGGNSFSTSESVVTIGGRAPVDAMQIVVVRGGTEVVGDAEIRFSDSDYFGWTAEVPLLPGANALEFVGLNSLGTSEIDRDGITVTALLDPPVIMAIDPPRAQSGGTVTITGSGFFAGLEVRFGDVAGVVQRLLVPDTIDVVVPEGVGPGFVDVVVSLAEDRKSEPFAFEVTSAQPEFLRGDSDNTGDLSLTDGVQILAYLYQGGSLLCKDAADTDDNAVLEVTDAVIIFNYLYASGKPPAPPFPAVGPDPGGELGCETPP